MTKQEALKLLEELPTPRRHLLAEEIIVRAGAARLTGQTYDRGLARIVLAEVGSDGNSMF